MRRVVVTPVYHGGRVEELAQDIEKEIIAETENMKRAYGSAVLQQIATMMAEQYTADCPYPVAVLTMLFDTEK